MTTEAATQPPPPKLRRSRRSTSRPATAASDTRPELPMIDTTKPIIVTLPAGEQDHESLDSTGAAELRTVTVVAFGVCREILELKPKPEDKDYAKLQATKGAVALGILNLKARIDATQLRDVRDNDKLAEILRRLADHDAKREPQRDTSAVLEHQPAARLE
jgi:hypothetical protein